jgi:hypothetical protein
MINKNRFLVKFTVVAAMIGLFSPSIQVETEMQENSNFYTALPLQVSVSLFHTAEARRGGGRVNRGGAARARPARSGNRNVNRNYNRNHNINRNVNRNVNVNVNHRYYGGYGRGYGYYGGRPVLAFTTGLVIGSVIAASTMPTTCTTVVANGISYRQCGSSYYQPFYQGDTLVYKVVASPY